jgi:hypothetical protein
MLQERKLESKFLSDSDKAVFKVFDGYGCCEVAIYCNQQYEKILNDS